MMQPAVFNENVVIITGASRGIGRELALRLAEQGAWLVLAARDAQKLGAVAETCRQLGGKALVVQTDVGEQADCQHLIVRTLAEYGRIDTLVNNAGISMWALFAEVEDLSIFERIMRINYLGSVYCTHYALPHLKKTRGRLVAVSSLTGKTGVPTRSGYAASKHAMVGFFDSLRVELLGTGVSVTISYPDFVATDVRKLALGTDGQPIKDSPVQEDKIMTVETSVQYLLRAMEKRRREDVQTLRGHYGQWIKLIAPKLVDKITRRAITRGK
ncbi:MAG: SDR family oxidoreductase [Anaerolineales bacterium]|nr:SDR family oxidoreductase [Anaerolineales bacterium]